MIRYAMAFLSVPLAGLAGYALGAALVTWIF